MAKLGDQKEVKVAGEEYTLQHPGMKKYLEMQDKAKNRSGVPSETKLSELFLENVVVSHDIDLAEVDSEVYFGLMEEIKDFLKS